MVEKQVLSLRTGVVQVRANFNKIDDTRRGEQKKLRMTSVTDVVCQNGDQA
ncbi:MAG TPA: hypothetical protein VI146_06255 [Nitrososphaeraceae archaeon]